jgi:lipoprotein-anchoring transpeptidase ErfK/SrfK
MPWAVFYHGNYAIHGTNAIKRLGKPASHGCVRLHPDNARILFRMIKAEGMENARVTVVP